MKEIILSGGQTAIVDDADYELVSAHKWKLDSTGRYVVRNLRKRTLYMHRMLLKAPTGLDVDHINGNGLDNRRENLRLATHAQNQCNQKIRTDNSSGYKGVRWHSGDRRWRARITFQGREIWLGNFSTAELAHAAYCSAAQKLHGQFARFN